MKEVALILNNLGQLDNGKIPAAFKAELDHVVKDCQDRPGDKRPRKVAITFLVAPKVNIDDQLGGTTLDLAKVAVGCEITSSVPKRRTRVYEMNAKADGTLGFHPESASDADANLLFDEDESDAKSGGDTSQQ